MSHTIDVLEEYISNIEKLRKVDQALISEGIGKLKAIRIIVVDVQFIPEARQILKVIDK